MRSPVQIWLAAPNPLKLKVSRGFSLFFITLSDYILFYTFFMKGCGLIMRSKIVFRGQSEKLFSEVFEDFIISQTARGISDITIRNYRQHLHSISKHLDISTPFEDLSKRQLDEMILSMRANGLAHNSIATYVRMLHTFFNWCNREGISDLNISSIREKETIKETYSDGLCLCSPSDSL